jgi:hypothetical protein
LILSQKQYTRGGSTSGTTTAQIVIARNGTRLFIAKKIEKGKFFPVEIINIWTLPNLTALNVQPSFS